MCLSLIGFIGVLLLGLFINVIVVQDGFVVVMVDRVKVFWVEDGVLVVIVGNLFIVDVVMFD